MENQALYPAQDPSTWDRVLAILEPRVGPGPFNTWFRPTRFVSRTGPTVRIRVPNQMFAEWLRSQYMQEIRSALGEAGFTGVENVEFDASAINGRGAIQRPHVPAVPERPDSETCPLNRRYTFDNFVVSSCNQFAHAAAHAVSEKPGRAYNPLFLYGGVGLGKTHLMQAIGAQILRDRPTATVRYMTSEQFMNALISAIRYEDTPRFRDRYRSVDVLLIDDVQFLTGKESTQEEFFHTFNALYDSGRQIVLTSDCPPRSIPALEERLRSRFEWGLLADLQPPDLETKVAILNKMAGSQGLRLPPEVALFIASNVRSNVRELEGSLTTLIAASSIHRRPLDLDLAHEVIKTLVPAEREPVTIDAILRVVARHFSLKVSDLKAKTNARRITNPRQIAMYLAKTLAGESLPAIGKLLGGKHHTTVLHAVRKIEKLQREDPSTEKLIAKLREELDG